MRRDLRDTRTYKVFTDPRFWVFLIVLEALLLCVLAGIYGLAEALR